MAPRDRNLIRSRFLTLDLGAWPGRTPYREEFGLLTVGHSRSTAARYPDDPEIRALIAEIWPARRVEVPWSVSSSWTARF